MFNPRSQNYEKRLLASSCPSIWQSVRRSIRMQQFGYNWMDFLDIQ
jgi:hypothetical protein